MINKLLDRILAQAFPGIEPLRFVWGPALSPLKTELLGLRRNHARDEIRLNEMREEYYAGRVFFSSPSAISMGVRWNHPMDRLEAKQDRREARIEQIRVKLERDGRMKAPKPPEPGAT